MYGLGCIGTVYALLKIDIDSCFLFFISIKFHKIKILKHDKKEFIGFYCYLFLSVVMRGQ